MAVKNSELYYEINMLRLLFKAEYISCEEYKKILRVVLNDSNSVILTA